MLLFVSSLTPRLKYITSFVASELFGEPFTYTSDETEYQEYAGPRINYSDRRIADAEFYLMPHSLLFETVITQQDINVTEFRDCKIFFQTNGDHPFDIFAASFYLLSRYEEYLPHQKDEYGRFAHTESLAFKAGFLHQPLINFWIQQFRDSLRLRFPTLIFRTRTFKFVPTYDIDIAWSYKYKGWRRTIGAIWRNVAKMQWTEIGKRLRVLQGKEKDPFDCYEWLDALHLYCKLRPCYFFLVAEKQQGFDRNISPGKKPFQDLIAYQSQRDTVGIHPSWQSGDHPKLLREEIGWLEFLIDKPIVHSRQHYIRMTLPQTYRSLGKEGITQDFSMGYGSINGFRASVASSFQWYDLEAECESSLVIKPFCFMDANSYYEQKFTPQQAFSELMHYYNVVKKANGLLITLWHNNFLGTDPAFKGWREVYEIFLKEEVYWDR